MEYSEILDINQLDDKSLVKKITANSNKFYLLPFSSKINLCDVIDKLSKNSTDQSALTRVRIAYDVKFDIPTQLCLGNNEQGEHVQSLAELLDKLEYDENLILKNSKDYHVVIDDENDKEKVASMAVAKLFQQTVFLNLNLDIKMKSEIAKSIIKDRFRSNYTKLRTEIDAQREYLIHALDYANLTESGKKRVSNMAESFLHMNEGLEKARQRPIRIAAMGTKKAGKSVVINSLLKRDYAPTSSELPTPNVIKYIPAPKDASLTLDYKGKTGISFHSAKELSDYIGREFENAQKHTGEGSGLEDMVIHYPSDDLNGYEVWDTPGPNFAGAGEEHHKIADECIKEADVCIFVMNYSNHLTDDEVKFLQKIHKTFQEENKFYSLFITVNRIDERYAAEVEKSVNRILDYIRGRLEELDYKNIIIFGTSALQSFYLDKVLKLLDMDNVVMDEDNTLYDAVRSAKKAHRDFMTPLRFVEDSIKNLEDFHEIDNPDENALENFSGIPQLWHHVRYIGEQKVDTEIVDHVVSSCEMEFDKINNALLVTELVNLSEEDSMRLRDLQNKIFDLKHTVDSAMEDVTSHTGDSNSYELKGIKYDVDGQIKDVKRDAVERAVTRSNEIVRRVQLTDYDVEEMQKGNTTNNIKKCLEGIDDILKGANDVSEEKFLKVIEIEGGNLSKRIEKIVSKAQDKIIAKTEEVKQSIDSNSVAGNMMHSFAIPQFPVSLNMLSSKSRGLNIDISGELAEIAKDSKRMDKEIRTRTVTRRRKSKGLWEGFRSFFGKKYYEDVEEEYSVDVVKADAEKFKKKIKNLLDGYIEEQLDESHKIMADEVMNNLDEIYKNLGTQCQSIGNTYKEIFDTFSDDINNALDETNAHKQAVEHDIAVLTDIKTKVQPFFELWHNILNGKAIG